MGKDQELLEAARSGHIAVVERILQQRARRSGPLASLRRGPGANVQDSSGYTPLHHAALNGRKEIIELLLAADASPTVVDKKGLSPLHLAAWSGNADIVSILLSHNVNPVNIDLAFQFRVQNTKFLAKALLAGKPMVYQMKSIPGAILPNFIISPNIQGISAEITSRDHIFNIKRTKTKDTALHLAAHFNHVGVVSQLLARGADPYLTNEQGDTPLDLAAHFGRLETVQHLLLIRPDLVQQYRSPASYGRIFKNTPLHRASKNGHEQVVEVLLAAGVHVNIRTESGTALHEAAQYGKEGVVLILLERGADVNLQDGNRRTVSKLLKDFTAPAHLRIRDVIKNHLQRNGYDCPPFPNDRSPSCYDDPDYDYHCGMDRPSSMNSPMTTPETKNISIIKSSSSSSVIKNHSNNFVKKITTKCLGLKAKFNSAPNISNTGLSTGVELRSKPNNSTIDRGKITNTLHIGNSKFFKKLSKKRDEPIDVICNDEFDTISLDRLVTMDRSSVNNRSNRSCPGFKVSLPNISENTELSCDSKESLNGLVIQTHDDNDNVLEAYNSAVHSYLPHDKLDSDKATNNDTNIRNSLNAIVEDNELYETCESDNRVEMIKPSKRISVARAFTTIYENVSLNNCNERPKPPARNVLPIINSERLDSRKANTEEPIYENLVMSEQDATPFPAKRTIVPTKSNETDSSCSSNANEFSDLANQSSTTSTLSSDTKIDYSNFEDILMSKKSKSFRNTGQITVYAQSRNDEDSDNSSETSSVVSEFNTIEDVDCSLESNKANEDYLPMTRTLPKPSLDNKNKNLFRNVTFSNATSNFKKPERKSVKENTLNYHIRGTGHCIYQAPTVQEFIYVFNRDTLTHHDIPPFSKIPNNRDSYFETAICFCKPNELKHHKSADDLLALPDDDNISSKVYIDTESLFKRVAIESSSFRCYCCDGACTLHHKKRQSSSFAVKFHAFNRSVSTPDLLSATNDGVLNAKATDLESPYAVVDLSGIRFSQFSTLSSDDTSLTFGALSEPSTLSSTLRRPNSPEFHGDTSSTGGTLRSEASSLRVASLDGGSRAGRGSVRSGSDVRGRRWDEGDVLSEADALSVSSAASSSAPLHLIHHHRGYNKVSPTPPKKPPRRNLSVSPTHANSPAVSYDQLRAHARSQDDLDELQGAKHYLKHGRSIDQCVDGKYSDCADEHSPRIIPIPKPRPSLRTNNQPVAITAMYENVVIKEQNPKRKLRRNFTHQYENFDPSKMASRNLSTQERSSMESLLDSPSENYGGVKVPLSPTHYDQPPTPDHPPPSAKQAENSIHERIRPLSQEYKRRSALRDLQKEMETSLQRPASAASVASGATDRSANTDNCVEEYVCDVPIPFAGLFKGSTTTLDGIGLRPVPAERPKTLRKLKSAYDSSPTEPVHNLVNNGHDEDVVRRRSNTTSSNHSADKSLSILSPFDEQEEWAKISEIMASFGSKLVRESVFVSELEQEFTSRLGLSCSESSLSPSVVSSVGHWLNGLGIADYESLFIEKGFDEVDFINGILDENDLRDMGIEEADRAKILEAVKQLPHKIGEISTTHNNNYNNHNTSKHIEYTESVEDWLKNISLEQYADTFRKHLYVDMDRVRRIWEVELTAVLEIQKPGHRKRILASVSGQQNGPANNMDDINADLNMLKNNIQQLKDEIKEKLPSERPPPRPHHPGLAPPGGETLKRSKKNRPAPQPPKPSDLEIRAPSELLVGVPGALKTQWRHQPFVLVSGAVTYVANYLGSTVVKELRGTESTKKSIQKLKKSTKEPRDSPDIILSISYRGVKFLNTITRDLVCEHEIRNIHCACQDADDLTHFAYITKDHATKSHYCHVFCVATMDQATEVILTLGEAFEVAYQMALREQFTKSSTNRILHGNAGSQQAKTPTHDPMTTSAAKEKPNLNHGRSHSITEIKLNGHQLKIAPVPASLSNEDFQLSVKSDGSRSPRTPLMKAPIASTEEL